MRACLWAPFCYGGPLTRQCWRRHVGVLEPAPGTSPPLSCRTVVAEPFCLDPAVSASMGFLKKFFRNVYHEDAALPTASAFEAVSEEQLEAHLGVARYGSF